MRDLQINLINEELLTVRGIEKKCFDMGIGWIDTGFTFSRYLPLADNICLAHHPDGKVYMSHRISDTPATEIHAEDFMAGKYTTEIRSWMGKKPVETHLPDFKVDISWLRGKAREVISEAIQKKAFEKGFMWAGDKTARVQMTHVSYLFFKGKVITQSNKDEWFVLSTRKEISVNDALDGVYTKPYSKAKAKKTEGAYTYAMHFPTRKSGKSFTLKIVDDPVRLTPFDSAVIRQIAEDILAISGASSKKSELKPGDAVLVRDSMYGNWQRDILRVIAPNAAFPYKCAVSNWKQCIPLRGNEWYQGTTKVPKQ